MMMNTHTRWIVALITALILASLSVTGCTYNTTSGPSPTTTPTPTYSAPTNFMTYENSDYGFSIKYPPTWERVGEQGISEPSGGSKPIVAFQLPTHNALEWVAVSVVPSLGSVTLKEMTQANLNAAQKFPNYNLIDSGPTTLAGNPAQKIVFTATTDQHDLEILMMWTMSNGSEYMITYKAYPHNYDTYLGTAQQMIDSFNIE